MCEFVSWIEYEGKEYFLTNVDLLTKEGKNLLAPNVRDDLCGHGAIRSYYPELKNKGQNKECTDFSTQKNFPKAIAKALKNGQMSYIGISTDMLTKPALAEYRKIEQPALAEYEKIEQQAWAEYRKIEQPALAEYEKIKQQAWAEYRKIEQPAWAEYEKIEQPALAEYRKIEQPALAEYRKIEQPAFTNIVKQKKNRNKNWK